MKLTIEHWHVISLSPRLALQIDRLLEFLEPVDTSKLDEAAKKSETATGALEKTLEDSQT